MKPGYPALAKACLRVFQPDGQQYLKQWISYQAERWYESRYRQYFRKTGLLVAGPNNVSSLFEKALLPPHFTGHFWRSHSQRRQRIGGRQRRLRRHFSDRSVQSPALQGLRSHPQTAEAPQADMPLLTYESDGYAVLPSFLRQVEVHIEQVLERAGQRNAKTAAASPWRPHL